MLSFMPFLVPSYNHIGLWLMMLLKLLSHLKVYNLLCACGCYTCIIMDNRAENGLAIRVCDVTEWFSISLI